MNSSKSHNFHGSSGPLWLPENMQLGSSGDVYILPATFRGEMYHYRAAMALYPCPLVICDYIPGKDTTQLLEYVGSLAMSRKQDVFVTPWSYADMIDLARHQTFPQDKYKECMLNAHSIKADVLIKRFVNFILEYGATLAIVKLATSASDVKKMIAPAMGPEQVLTSPQVNFQRLHEEFAKIFPKPLKGHTSVLVLHRDSGEKSGVYPEFDSGGGLAQLVDAFEAVDMRVILCGTTDGKRDTLNTYWATLEPLFKAFFPNGIPQRAAEAYFFAWAYDQGYFSLVTGFRSGLVDMFTLLGIPTVSVALRNGVGEVRHEMLAVPQIFKRVNLQYDQPRHNATAWRAAKGKGGEQLQSPYWRDVAPQGVIPRVGDESKQLAMLKQPPVALTGFDRAVLDLGVRVAASALLDKPQAVKRLDGRPFSGVITTADLRRSAPLGVGEGDARAFLKPLREMDAEDLSVRKEKSGQLQETLALYQQYEKESTDWWNSMKL